MKCTIKKRGLTIIGVMIAVGLLGSSTPFAMHYVAHRNSEQHLEAIEKNLVGIDMAVEQWTSQSADAEAPTQANLDGSGGTTPFVAWPEGPVSGKYEISDFQHTLWVIESRPGVPACATFNGGSKGPMNRLEWQKVCGADPASCGI